MSDKTRGQSCNYAEHVTLAYFQPFADTQPMRMGSKRVPSTFFVICGFSCVYPSYTTLDSKNCNIQTGLTSIANARVLRLSTLHLLEFYTTLFVRHTLRFSCALRTFPTRSAKCFPWNPRFLPHISRTFPHVFLLWFCAFLALSVLP